MDKLFNLLIYGNKIKGTPQEMAIIKNALERGCAVYLKNANQ